MSYFWANKNTSTDASIGAYRGRIVIVDGMNYLYGKIIGSIPRDARILDIDEWKNLHIKKMFDFATNLTKYGMMQIWVWDGKCPEEKKKAVNKRNNDKRDFRLERKRIIKLIKAMDDLRNKEKMIDTVHHHNHSDDTDTSRDTIDINMQHDHDDELLPPDAVFDKDIYDSLIAKLCECTRRCYTLSSYDIDECKKVLELLGIPYINAPGEADTVCASLAIKYKDYLAGVITNDSDIIMYGAPCILRNFSFKNCDQYRMTIKYEKIISYLLHTANDILSKKNLPQLEEFTYENFVHFAILPGTDYTIGDNVIKINNIPMQELFEICVTENFNMYNIAKQILPIDTTELLLNEFVHTWVKTGDIYTSNIARDISSLRTNNEINDADTSNNVRWYKKNNMYKNIVPTGIDDKKIIEFMCDDRNFDEYYVRDAIKNMASNYETLRMMYSHSNIGNKQYQTISYQFNHYKNIREKEKEREQEREREQEQEQRQEKEEPEKKREIIQQLQTPIQIPIPISTSISIPIPGRTHNISHNISHTASQPLQRYITRSHPTTIIEHDNKPKYHNYAYHNYNMNEHNSYTNYNNNYHKKRSTYATSDDNWRTRHTSNSIYVRVE